MLFATIAGAVVTLLDTLMLATGKEPFAECLTDRDRIGARLSLAP